MFKLIRLLLLLSEIIGGIRDGYVGDEKLLAKLPEDLRALAKSASRRLLGFVFFGTAIFIFIIPIAAPLCVIMLDGISSYDAKCRGVMLLLFAPITLPIGIYFGFALGFIASPRWLTDSPLGEKWRLLVGVRTREKARKMCYVMVSVGILIIGVLAWLCRTMRGFSPG